MKIEEIAEVCHEINRAYCQALGLVIPTKVGSERSGWMDGSMDQRRVQRGRSTLAACPTTSSLRVTG